MKNLKKKCRWSFKIFLILSLTFSFTACLDIEKINIYLMLDKDDLYSGKARIEFINIHSTSVTIDEQKKDMDGIFADYKKEAENIIREMTLFNHAVELRNKTGVSTDAVISGEFKNVLAVLSSIMKESNFKVEGNRKKLSTAWGNPFTDNTETNLIIQYPGKIVSNNSKSFDPKTGTMKWNMSKNGDKEVKFVFESD